MYFYGVQNAIVSSMHENGYNYRRINVSNPSWLPDWLKIWTDEHLDKSTLMRGPDKLNEIFLNYIGYHDDVRL